MKESEFVLQNRHLPRSFRHKMLPPEDRDCEEYIIRANLKTMEDIQKWLDEFGQNSNTQWNARKSNPNGERKISKQVVCHHSSFMKVDKTENKRGLSKNASCPARIRISIAMLSKRNCNTEFMKADLWATIRISKKHTHSLNSAQTLRFLQDQDDNMRRVFHEYFMDNMTAAEAVNHHQGILKLRNATEEDFANARTNPTIRTISYWYDEWRRLNLGPRSGPELISKLAEKKNIYAKDGIVVAYETEPLCVCVLTPTMQRAHVLTSAKNHLFIDTTSSCDPGQHSITFLLTSCPAGSIPLGLVITKGQTTEAYTKAFQLFQKTTSDYAFGKQGFPTTILTDNSAAEIAAIKATWPNSNHFLCVFHILQAVWRWLHNSDNKISHDDKTALMVDFRRILRAENLVEMQSAYDQCLENGSRYPQWINYVQNYWLFKEKWCVAYRDEKMRGHHTNNYSEANIRIFKDVILSRVKAYNLISLVDFCATALEDYHVAKLRDFANFRNRKSYLFFQKCLKKVDYLSRDDIISINDHLFLVPSQTSADQMYTVDCDIGACSCIDGKFGKFCKHQCAVYQFHNLQFTNFPSITVRDRFIMAKIALGKDKVPDISFYDSFIEELDANEEVGIAETDLPVVEACVINDRSSPSDHTRGNSSNDLDTHSDESVDDTEDVLNRMVQKLMDTVRKHTKSKIPAISAMKKYTKRLDNITNEELLLKFLHTTGIKRFKSGSKIGVQPTSISRRKSGITRGARRIAAGRIAREENMARTPKRRHNISQNIVLNSRN